MFPDSQIHATDSLIQPYNIAGRTYAADYLLPVDAQDAVERQSLQHYALYQMMHAPYIAPIRDPQHAVILDVGTGPGRWPIEIARRFPLTRTVGMDINPLPLLGTLPGNFTFVQASILHRIPYPDETFDLVHQRMLNFAIPVAQWVPHVVDELARVTRVGGFVELMEWGGYLRDPGPAMGELVDLVRTASLSRGINLDAGQHVHHILMRGRFTQIACQILWVPVGKHGGHVGQMMQVDSLALIEGLRGPLTKFQMITEKRFDDLMEQAKAQLEVWACFMPFYIAYGQRV